MLRNTEINHLMTTILLRLMPRLAQGTNNELWALDRQLQEWKMAVQWKYTGIGTDRTAEMAESILTKLEALPDRELAQEIGRVVRKHTLAHQRKMKNVACGRVIGDWQINHPAMALPAKDKLAAKTRLSGSHYTAAPAAR